MKTKLSLLAALVALQSATTQAQIPITTNTLPPVVGLYDQDYLPGPVDEATGAMTIEASGINTSSADNDILTYVAGDKASKGQSFTTGSNPAGYVISSVTFRHILWTNFLSNGTFMSIPNGANFLFRFGTISGANITSILTTNATYSGATLSQAGVGGTGIYFTFNLTGSGIGTLAPNTTYFFEIASTANPPYFELHNTRTNATSYANGTAFYGDTVGALDQSGVVNLPPYGGDFAFDASLQAVGAPSVVATANPVAATSGHSVTITATVTPGNGTVTNVSVNLSSIGGPSASRLVLSSGNVYTNTFTVPAGAPLGTAILPVTAIDTTPLSGTYGLSFAVLPNTVVWDGSSSSGNNWSDTNNWQAGFAPSFTGNTVFFAGTARPLPNMDNSYSLTELIFSNTAGSFSIGSSIGGTLTTGTGGILENSANTQVLNVPVVLGSSQTFNAAAGSLTLNTNVTGSFDLTTTGAGAVTFANSGTNSIGNLQVTGNGQLNITTGTVNVNDNSGNSTMVDSNATLLVSGGTLNILGSTAGGWFPIGQSTGATGTVVVAGGSVNVNDQYGTELGNVLNGAGAGVLTINSGTFINNDAAGIGFMLGENGSAGGIVNLNGGTLIVNQIIAHSAGGNFYFNGGALEPLASSAGFWANAGPVTASVRNGGAVVNTAGFNVTIGQPLLHSTVSGDNATDGGLTKVGNGTLTLSGGYFYTGPNLVLGGTLALGSGQGVPPTGGNLVVSNATLLLDASSGNTLPAANVTLNSGASLILTNNPSSSAIGGTGNLLVQSNTILNLNYGTLGANPGFASINVGGSVSVTGTNNLINVFGTGFGVGEFPLIQYGSGSLASISGLRLGALPPGVNAVLTNNTANKSVDLNITFIGQSLTWYGANSSGSILSNWDINVSPDWNNGAAKYLEYDSNTFGDLVTFDDTLYNQQSTNVNLTTTLHPSQITENSSLPYSLTGAGSIAGAGFLTMSGSGSLTLGTSNSYTGGTFLNAGTLIVTNDNALGTNTGALTLNGGTVEYSGNSVSTRPVSLAGASVIDVVSGATVQLTGTLSGTADLTTTDNGTLILANNGTNSIGDLRVSNGQLNITSGTVNVTDASGTLTRVENNATLTVSGGTLNIFDGGNGWFPIGVTIGSTGTVVVAGGTINVHDHWGTQVGNEAGAGVFTINSGTFINNDIGGIGFLVGEFGSMGGTVNLNGGALIVNLVVTHQGGSFYFNGGTLQPIASNAGFWASSAALTAAIRNGGAVLNTAGFNVTVGQPLLHSPVVGDNTKDGGLIKAGLGTLTLSGANTYTGNTTINAGTLELAQTVATLATNASVLIASNAVLQLDSSAVTNVVASFTTNGVAAGAGLYSSANGSGFITGSGLLLVLGVPVGPTGPGFITNRLSGNTLTLSWPAGNGWRLVSQTNGLSHGLNPGGSSWGNVPGVSDGSATIIINPANSAVFYRLTYP